MDRSVADTIETLADRLETSTLSEDRRDACRALKSLARDYRVEVCAQALDILLQLVKNDKQHTEILLYCLESLNYIITGPLADSPAGTWPNEPTTNDPGREMAEIFLKKSTNVKYILDTVEENDYRVRWASLRLLCGLARHQLKTFQETILSIEQSIPPLVELISDENELIRNDALVFFSWLTPNNPNIQNLSSYCNCIEKLMYIIQTENYLEGTVTVVMDCLEILLNLLEGNESNQLLFREENQIPKLLPFFNDISTIQWTNERVDCIMFVLRILDTMLKRNNSPTDLLSCRQIMLKVGLFDRLCDLLRVEQLPIGVMKETLNTASDMIRDHLSSNRHMVMSTSSMLPILWLSQAKDMYDDQEKRLSELMNYVHLLYNRLSNT